MTPFSEHIVTWQRQHGRHALPWQNTHDPYRIWLSEIMLQQTQVATVIPYYARFLEAFLPWPTLPARLQNKSWSIGPGWVITPAPATCTPVRSKYSLTGEAAFHLPLRISKPCPA
jgi:hypothetical protein